MAIHSFPKIYHQGRKRHWKKIQKQLQPLWNKVSQHTEFLATDAGVESRLSKLGGYESEL